MATLFCSLKLPFTQFVSWMVLTYDGSDHWAPLGGKGPVPRVISLVFALCTLAGVIVPAAAEKRVALIIGNSTYKNVTPLPNPSSDAAAFAALLKTSGFDLVDSRQNLTVMDMRRAVRDFTDNARDADIAVVFYAGHGLEVDGTNYLLPVDALLERDSDVEDEALSLDRIVRALEPVKRLRLIVLDACRDNPFARSMKRTLASRSVGRGLGKVEVETSNTLIAFAAKAGSTAADGVGDHSPFTTALLNNIATPGLDLRLALGRVRDEVLKTTSSRQEPFVYGSLGGTTVTLVPEPAKAAAVPTPDPNADARRDYELASQVGTKEAWDSFLALHGTGFYAALARGQRAKLNADTATVATHTTAAAPNAPPPSSTDATPPASPPSLKPPATALTSIAPPAETAKATTDPSETANLMHVELRRLGCYPGAVDASWGSDSRRAMELFNKSAGANIETKFATLDTLDVLRAKPTRVCPLECKPGYRSENEACVKIACRSGFVANEKGDCERERQPKAKSASRPDSREAKPAAPRQQAGEPPPAQIVCGMNGCLNVKKGCKSQMVASGNSQVAVVTCDK